MNDWGGGGVRETYTKGILGGQGTLHEKDYGDQEILAELIVGPRNSAICDFWGPVKLILRDVAGPGNSVLGNLWGPWKLYHR